MMGVMVVMAWAGGGVYLRCLTDHPGDGGDYHQPHVLTCRLLFKNTCSCHSSCHTMARDQWDLQGVR